jgi:hypothetical protein
MMLPERILEVWFEVLLCGVTLLPCAKIYITDHFLIHFLSLNWNYVVPWHRHSTSRPGFSPSAVHVGFVVDKVALGQVLPQVLWFSPVSIIPLMHHIHSCIIWGTDNGPVISCSSTETYL